uniref:Uncharacterized protein n=1 Tax=Ananas comosus var. bracteatus TaxID=296719 RepID=A0A6V7PZR0_ANACO|nr:unnamed protein product [Ananas comosus var. bracteatus]
MCGSPRLAVIQRSSFSLGGHTHWEPWSWFSPHVVLGCYRFARERRGGARQGRNSIDSALPLRPEIAVPPPRQSSHPRAPRKSARSRSINISEQLVEEDDRTTAGLFAGDSIMECDELHNVVIQICQDVQPLSSLSEVPEPAMPEVSRSVEVGAPVAEPVAEEEAAEREVAEPEAMAEPVAPAKQDIPAEEKAVERMAAERNVNSC